MDAGLEIGFGHVRRSLTLAAALHRLGIASGFIAPASSNIAGLVASAGFPFAPINPLRDLQETCECVRQWGATIVGTDFYGVDDHYLSALHAQGWTVFVLDDLGGRRLPADLILNTGAVGVCTPLYDALPGTRFLVGPEYALLREEFTNVPERVIAPSVDRVLISMGGSDSSGLSPKVAHWVAQALPGTAIDVIIGPFFTDEIKRELTGLAAEVVRLHEHPDSMRKLMLASDLAICAGGQTCYELAATGTPTLAIRVADYQRLHLDALARLEVLLLVGEAGDSELERKLKQALIEVTANPEMRTRTSKRGRRLVDGHGASRVASAIALLATKVGSQSALEMEL